MKIVEKITYKQSVASQAPAVTIALLGDSVTQGCFECYTDPKGNLKPVYDYDSSYGSRLQSMLHVLYPRVPIHIINAGVSGDSAQGGLRRLDRDVLSYRPDLVVVGFALNDSMAGAAGIEAYKAAMNEIVKKVVASGAECIVLTPNTMNTEVSDHLKEASERKLAEKMATLQNGGVLDLYADAAREIASKNGAVLCDVYAKWKKMMKAGVEVTELLSNKLNHPIRSMHYLTAMMLLDCILG